MATQTIQFDAVSVTDAGSGTITAQLLDGDTNPMLADIAEAALPRGRYTGTLTDHVAGVFELIVYYDGKRAGRWDLELGATTGTYVAKDFVQLSSATIAAIQAGLALQSTVNTLLGMGAYFPVERSTADENPITFAWPASAATITVTKSINSADPYTAATGTVSFLRTENDSHYYTLSYAAADRPSAEGVVRYRFTDGMYTKYLNVRITEATVELGELPSGECNTGTLESLIATLMRMIGALSLPISAQLPNNAVATAIPAPTTGALLAIGTSAIVTDGSSRYFMQRVTIVGHIRDNEYMARTANGTEFGIVRTGVVRV